MHPNIRIENEILAEFCRKWKVRELSIFGSVLRDDFKPESDVDVLVTFAADATLGMFAFIRMRNELKQIVGREVDLVSRRGLEASPNYLRRQAILSSSQILYAA